ncbi:MAG: GNAT family N-acetyltransferase, partial [Flavobacterium sp.]
VYLISDFDDLEYDLMDRKITYQIKDIASFLQSKDIQDTRQYFINDQKSYSEILDLTLQSGVYSRFSLDSNFKNDEYEKLYTEWINKSISKEVAVEVLVKNIDNTVVGFSTLTQKSDYLADIGLVAVDSKYRGRGIGKEVILNTILEAHNRGFKSIQVVTQLDNGPANTLYQSSGFSKESIKYIYHLWNK